MKTTAITMLAVFLAVSSFGWGQERIRRIDNSQADEYARPQNFGIGASVGVNTFTGDVQSGSSQFPNAENSWLVGGQAHCAYRFGALGEFATTHIVGRAGYHALDGSSVSERGEYSFTNSALQISALLQFEMFPTYTVRPYVSVGFGMLLFDHEVTASGRQEYDWLQPGRQGASKFTATVPLGGGAIWSISESIDLMAGVEKTVAFSDDLDRWESNVFDNWLTINVGATFFFGNGQKVIEEHVPVKPMVQDSDADGLSDNDETTIYKTNPNNRDTDSDGLMDGEEALTHKTDPLNKDTDGDGVSDGAEVKEHKTNPLANEGGEK